MGARFGAGKAGDNDIPGPGSAARVALLRERGGAALAGGTDAAISPPGDLLGKRRGSE